MRASRHGEQVTVRLSRRNLESLLNKLNGFPRFSACTLIGGSDAMGITIIAEEDEIHYFDRPPGAVHPESLDRPSQSLPELH